MNTKLSLAALLVLFMIPFASANTDNSASSIITTPVFAEAVPAPQPTLVSEPVVEDSPTIHKLFQERQISAEDMNAVSDDVRVLPAAIVTETELESAVGKVITVGIQGKTVTVTPNFNTIVIQDGTVIVNTAELHLQNGKMFVGATEVNAAPSQIMEKVQERGQNMTEKRESVGLKLEESNGKAVYAHYAIEQRKLLGVFPMNATITEQYDAETGDFIKEARPWWYDFTLSG
ncbi:MAG: hypothetical protein PHC66_01680 [Candidatus Nanoarchaeia archaeon]|nr:hypothetical protein [Candidatus Nanoarchaeia archaeon]MDD5238922.1 hypothetical protein [Candidatus Nanoarchaeia archaeon]